MSSQILIRSLLAKYPLLSDQVTLGQIETILTELVYTLNTKVSGEVVEFGCYLGTTSIFIQRVLTDTKDPRAFHVYDSFAGLPEKSDRDYSRAGEQFQSGELSVSKKSFIRNFQKAHLPIPVIHKSWFEDLTDQDIPLQIAFAFLDGDFYNSILDSLVRIVPRMSKGGVIIIDDYAREALPGVAAAVHDYASQHPEFKQSYQSIRIAHNLGILHL